MAKRVTYRTAPDGSVWIAHGGTARLFESVATGEVLPRRQWDKRYGSLARGGFISYERKAKASPAVLRQSRPAINRPSARTDYTRLKALRPLTERRTREVSMPFYGFYDGDMSGYIDDVEQYRDAFTTAIQNIHQNLKIEATQFIITGINKDGNPFHLTVHSSTEIEIPFDTIVSDILEWLYKGDQTISLIFHVRFKKAVIPTSKRKQEMAQKRRLKTQRTKQAKARKARK